MKAPVVPPKDSTGRGYRLDVALAGRRGCRAGLDGKRVLFAGRSRVIDHNAWGADSAVVVWLKVGEDATEGPIPASECVLLSRWPGKCCKPTVAKLMHAERALIPAT